MNIGLVDVDGHNGFPNLALMKLSAWHKAQGDSVEWYSPLLSGHLDKVYMSKVFTFSKDYEYPIDADEIVCGGTGFKEYEKTLPEEVEHTFPDYSIYPNFKSAIGFLTRGCIRNCPWCVVPKKEGKIHAVETWQNIKRPDSREIIFMDNNVLASDHGIAQIEDMIGKNVLIDFNQALDARLVTKEIAEILSRVKWIKSTLRFACDSAPMIPVLERTVNLLQECGVKPYRLMVYTLIQDVEESHKRILEMDKLGVIPFAQPYRDFNGGEPTQEQKDLARWCNRREIHKTVPFERYTR